VWKLGILILILMFFGGCVTVVWTPYLGDEGNQKGGNLMKIEKREVRRSAQKPNDLI